MTNSKNIRVHQIDLLRGLIIIFMILDHAMVYCRDYFVTDPMQVPGTEAHVFISRFLAHFCAPLFVFLAGLSASLTENRYTSARDFAVSLITRGAVLILLEFTIISWSWSFNPAYPMLYAQVIWAIGWGFIGLGLVRLIGINTTFVVGVVIVLGHNLLDAVRFEPGTAQHYLWSVLHHKQVLSLPFDFRVRTTYPILPIIGLMMVSYTAGRYYQAKGFSSKVNGQAAMAGLVCLVSYLVLRGFNLYGDAGQFTVQDSVGLTLMSLFNPTKYPLSLQFMLLTVGAGLIALMLFSKTKPEFSKGFLQVLGKTSMFSYIAHLYLLHALSWLLIPVMGYSFNDMTYGSTLIGLPEGFGLSYLQTLALTAVAIGLTWWLARFYINWKRNNKTNLIAKYI